MTSAPVCLTCQVPGGCNERHSLCRLTHHWRGHVTGNNQCMPVGYVTLMQIGAEIGVDYMRIYHYVRSHAAKLGARQIVASNSLKLWIVPVESIDQIIREAKNV